MTREELLKKIKAIDIKTSLISKEFLIGNYHSFFKGNGMEFSDIRKYEMGDDVRRIDWKTSARLRKTYIKEYKEERELSIYILVDISASNDFKNKKDMITEVSACLSYTAYKNNDKVGLLLFSDKIEKFILAKKGNINNFQIIDALLTTKPESQKTSIDNALNYINKIRKKPAIIFLISDFLDENYEKTLKLTMKKHEVIPIRICDKKFHSLPKGYIYNLRDSENNELVTVGSLKEEIKFNEESLPRVLDIYTEEDYIKSLVKFFKRR